MKQYTLYLGGHTQDKKPVEFDRFRIETLDTLFDGYTLNKTTGAWRGEQEPTFVVMVLTNDVEAIQLAAKTYKAEYDQESVLVTVSDPEYLFL